MTCAKLRRQPEHGTESASSCHRLKMDTTRRTSRLTRSLANYTQDTDPTNPVELITSRIPSGPRCVESRAVATLSPAPPPAETGSQVLTPRATPGPERKTRYAGTHSDTVRRQIRLPSLPEANRGVLVTPRLPETNSPRPLSRRCLIHRSQRPQRLLSFLGAIPATLPPGWLSQASDARHAYRFRQMKCSAVQPAAPEVTRTQWPCQDHLYRLYRPRPDLAAAGGDIH